ncbi:MAG TPA: hypothetical protein ENK50_03640, partial [Sedimenticola sp.]|nr:hypothetical protein [Sedimenticola sp.]
MKMRKRRLISALCGVALSMAIGSAQAVTNFEQDVASSIDLGLTWLNNRGAFNNPSSAGDAAGLVLLALLEKRPSGDINDPPQGYDGANAVDKARMENLVAYILGRHNAGVATYRNGAFMMGLSQYALSGGIEIPGSVVTLKQAMDTLTTNTLNAQTTSGANSGYWGYGAWGGDDSSTTQFAVAGLAAAKSFYSNAAYADPAKVTSINEALARARQAYVNNASTGSDNAQCADLGNGEKGHGYRRTGYKPTLAQTASGTWVQLLGGADLNDPSVQSYLRWLYQHYRRTDLDSMGNAWPSYSNWYFWWSSFKAFELMDLSGVAPDPGNLGPEDIGTLPVGDPPSCNVREEHRDPAADPRIAKFGAEGPGYYGDEAKRVYYDYAYRIMELQAADGKYRTTGGWNDYSAQSFALLVLQRATGGVCVDTDDDGVCDDVDNCVNTPNPDQADSDTKKAGEPDGQWPDGVGDVCDNCPDTWNPD